MVTRIYFIISFLLLLSGLILIYKKSEKIDFAKSAIVSYITQLCLGAVLAGVYSIIKIPIQLTSIGTGYLILAVTIWGLIIWQKKIQSYSITVYDIYSLAVISIFFLCLFVKVFTPEIAIVYKNSDPGTHFGLAMRAYETKTVKRMYFAELYNSLVMELLEPFMVKLSLYKAFILADSFSNYVNILMFWVVLSTVVKSRLMKILSPFVCILYFLGWPFYSYVAGGYVYYGIGVTLVVYIVYLLIQLIQANTLQQRAVLLAMTALGVFSVAVCYMLFVPVVCLFILAALIYIVKREKIRIPRKLAGILLLSVLLFGGIIFCVMFFGYFKGNVGRIFTSLRLDGGIHKELYKDFLFMFPPVIYMGWYCYKHKKFDFIYIVTTIVSIITAVTLVVYAAGGMSGYYYYKMYYLIWLLFWLVCIEAVELFLKENRIFLLSYGVPVSLALIMMLSGADEALVQHGFSENNSSSFFPVYEVTKRYIRNSEETPEMSSLRSLCQYIQDNLGNEEDIILISSIDKYIYGSWYHAFTGYSSRFADRNSESNTEGMLRNIVKTLDEKYNYFIIVKTADCYQGSEEFLSEYESIYDDGYMGLYRAK